MAARTSIRFGPANAAARAERLYSDGPLRPDRYPPTTASTISAPEAVGPVDGVTGVGMAPHPDLPGTSDRPTPDYIVELTGPGADGPAPQDPVTYTPAQVRDRAVRLRPPGGP